MMNSMNNLKEQLKAHYKIAAFEEPTKMQLAFNVEPDKTLDVLAYLKSIGYGQLSLLTCIDWIEIEEFQLVYILFNWDNGIHLLVRTSIDRNNPKFRTIEHIYPGVKYYERDVHEFFGVEFEGNEDSYKHLFLELWEADCPLKKDFDPLEFSTNRYGNRKYETNFPRKVGGE
ncbi:MAG: NADH-quinone oxidoreductase subunit C [Clostridia bacterium]|nr:NADH-quinone oxidoreductase subunit C [Clostridia bacterium]